MPRIAPVVPPACAACYQQPLDKRYVDFEVAYDGSPLPEGPGGARYAVDDLIICETCIKDGAALVGFGDVVSAVASSERFAAAAEASEDRAVEAEETLGTVRAAFESLGVPPTVLEAPQGAVSQPTVEPSGPVTPGQTRPAPKPRKKVSG